jgi:hypothetical protein|tara:strand:+ start:182 stop:448 length:267 start_codon:yes stop_codon:yes gene_type:complete
MGSGSTKRKGAVDMGNTGYDKNDWEAYRWCIRNNIAIGAKAKANNAWYINITNNGSTYTSPESYGKTIIWKKIFEYCRYYYEKNKHRK